MSAATALRAAVVPRSVSIAHSHPAASLSLSTCGSLLSRVPSPLVAVVCSWLECVDLLTFFRANRTLVAVHHHQPAASTLPSSSALTSSSSTSSSSRWADWSVAVWCNARLAVSATSRTLLVEQVKSARRGQSSPDRDWSPLFPDIAHNDQPAHLCRLVLAATPHLRHVKIHVDTRSYGHMADMADVLDLLPALHTLVLSAEADDCTDQEQLYVPLSVVLARHPRLHALQCTGAGMDLSLADIVAIASHPALAHIDVYGSLHCGDDDEPVDLEFSPSTHSMSLCFEPYRARTGRSRQLCAGCEASSVATRIALLRHVEAQSVEKECDIGIDKLRSELEHIEAAADAG